MRKPTYHELEERIHYLEKELSRLGKIYHEDEKLRNRTEKPYSESKQHFRNLYQSSPVSIWEEDFSMLNECIKKIRRRGVKNLRTYLEKHPEKLRECASMVRIIDVNDITLEIFGAADKEEILGSLDRVFCEESYNTFLEEILAIDEGKTSFEAESVTRRFDGTKIHILLRWTTLPSLEEDLSRVIASIVDISPRIRAEDALQKSREQYHTLFNEMIDGYALHEIICDDSGKPIDYRFIDINPAFEKLTGLGKDIIGRTARDSIPGLEDYWVEKYGEVALTGEPVRFENYAAPLGRWYEVVAFQTEKGRFVTIFVDITDRKKAELALHKSELKFRTVADFTSDWEYWMGTDGGYIYISPSFEQITGYPVDRLMKDPGFMREIVHPDDREFYMNHLRDVAEKSDYDTVDFRIVTIKGNIRWIAHRCRAIFDSDGKWLGQRGSNRDFTERKLMETELKNQRDLLDKTFQSLDDAVFILDASNPPVIINCNDTAVNIFGYGKEEILGNSTTFLHINEEHLHYFQTQLFTEIIKNGGSFHLPEFRMKRKDGRELVTEHYVTQLVDESGERSGWVSVVIDITERKEAEEKLSYELTLNMMLASLSGSIISSAFSVKDIAGITLEYAKLLTGSQYGYVSEIDQHSGDNIIHTMTSIIEDKGKVHEQSSEFVIQRGPDGQYGNLWGHSLNTMEPFFTNAPASQQASSGLPEDHIPIMGFLSVPVILENKVIGQISLANAPDDYSNTDLSSIKRLASLYALAINRARNEEQLRSSLQEKEVLLKEIHHRVKNNMQIISSLLSLQAKKIRDDFHRELFTESQNRIYSMALVHEKLYQSEDMANIDFRQYTIELINYLIHSYGIDRNRISLAIDVDNIRLGIDTAIPCAQIINELLSNALKHAFPGDMRGTINIAFKKSRDNESCTLEVSDNGAGILPEKEIEHVMSLGLQIVRSLVNQLEGSIEIYRDIGTRFKISFPIRQH